VNVRVVERTEAGRCGYCRDQLHDEDRSSCPSCSVAYHRDCAAELGRCGTRGCRGCVVAVLRPVDLLIRARRRARLARLIPVILLLGILLSGIGATLLFRWRAGVAAREAAQAAAEQELGNKLGELAGIAQFQPVGDRLQRARALYKELLARGAVDRGFVEEQVRRGRGDSPFYRPSSAPCLAYPDGGTLEEVVERIVR
jgi:hypothetical protein